MIVPDVNMLVYAYDEGSPVHNTAKDWWEGLISGTDEVGLPWAVSTGFVRLMANPRVIDPPVAPVVSIGHVRGWLEHPHINPIHPGSDHLDVMEGILELAGTSRNVVTDAHIAALALEHDAEVHSRDLKFAQFPGLKWRDPLEARGLG